MALKAKATPVLSPELPKLKLKTQTLKQTEPPKIFTVSPSPDIEQPSGFGTNVDSTGIGFINSAETNERKNIEPALQQSSPPDGEVRFEHGSPTPNRSTRK